MSKVDVPQETTVRTTCQCWGTMVVVIVLAKHMHGAKCWGCGRRLKVLEGG